MKHLNVVGTLLKCASQLGNDSLTSHSIHWTCETIRFTGPVEPKEFSNVNTGGLKLTRPTKAQNKGAMSFECHQSHATGCFDTSSDTVF